MPCTTEPYRTYAWGLTNAYLTARECTVTGGAAVARLLAPVTYYAKDDSLWRVEGDPRREGATPERLAAGVARLDATAERQDGEMVETTTGDDLQTRVAHVEFAIVPTARVEGKPQPPSLVGTDIRLWNTSLADQQQTVKGLSATTIGASDETPRYPWN